MNDQHTAHAEAPMNRSRVGRCSQCYSESTELEDGVCGFCRPKNRSRVRGLWCRVRGHTKWRWWTEYGDGTAAYTCKRCGAPVERYRWAIRSNVVSENGWEQIDA